MNSRLFISVLAVFILVAGSISIVNAYTVLDTAAAIRAEGQIPFTPQALLDNFNAGVVTNAWNCATEAFSKSGTTASCTVSYPNNPAIVYGGTGRSLQLDYNVADTNSYAGYFSQLGGGSLTSPVAYTAISFYVRGAVGGEFFKIQLKNSSATLYPLGATSYYRNTAAVYITDYLDGGVTTAWQKVTIPFHNFANLDGWSSMIEFDIVFENAQGSINGSLAQGAIYIDNITFETGAVSAVRVDHFGDKLGVSALGGNMGTSVGGGASSDPNINGYGFSSAANDYYPYPNGLSLKYNVTPGGAWAATYIILGGGQDIDPNPDTNQSGWIAIPHDFSAYNYLYFVVRGRSGTENPKEMKVELVDNAGTKFVTLVNITTAFEAYKISLTAFTGLDKASIKQLTFVFEGDGIGNAGGNKAGFVLIDSVQFEQQ